MSPSERVAHEGYAHGLRAVEQLIIEALQGRRALFLEELLDGGYERIGGQQGREVGLGDGTPVCLERVCGKSVGEGGVGLDGLLFEYPLPRSRGAVTRGRGLLRYARHLTLDLLHVDMEILDIDLGLCGLGGRGLVAVEAYEIREDIGTAQRYAPRFDGGYYTYRHEHDKRGHGEKECT